MSGPDRVQKERGRYYRTSEGDYPSVTTILNAYEPKKKALDAWKAKNADWKVVRDRAALVGSLAHREILNPYAARTLPLEEIDFAIVDDDMLSDLEVCEALWDRVVDRVNPGETPLIEQSVWSTEYRYAGTFDMLTDDGVIVDLKTSKDAHRDVYAMQSAAYAIAAKERGLVDDLSTISAKVVRLDYRTADTDIAEYDSRDLARYFEQFLDVLDTFRQS